MGSHTDTPAWQSFELRMRARAAERRAARRRRRLRQLGFAVAALLVTALGALTALVALAKTPRPSLPEAPGQGRIASLQPLPLPFNWNVPEPLTTGSDEEIVDGEAMNAAELPRDGADLTNLEEENGTSRTTQAGTPPAPLRALPRPSQSQPRREESSRAERREPVAARPATTSAPEPLTAPPDPRPRPLDDERRETNPPERRVALDDQRGDPVSAARREPLGAAGSIGGGPVGGAGPTGTSGVGNARSTAAPPPAEPVPASNVAIAATPALSEPAPSRTPTVARVDPREPVRGVIERYRAAYERLDAAAARAVWPGVDAGALSRAFDSLESQQLSFDSCAIDVAGAAAEATCTGRARVVPKVGGGSQSTNRTWTFRLRQNGANWQIERAIVRE